MVPLVLKKKKVKSLKGLGSTTECPSGSAVFDTHKGAKTEWGNHHNFLYYNNTTSEYYSDAMPWAAVFFILKVGAGSQIYT